MENSGNEKASNGRLFLRRNFSRWKEKPFRTNNYLEFLAHYGAELVQIDGPIMVVRCKTGTELPLEHTGRLLMVKALLDEFGTVDGANKAIESYKASHP